MSPLHVQNCGSLENFIILKMYVNKAFKQQQTNNNNNNLLLYFNELFREYARGSHPSRAWLLRVRSYLVTGPWYPRTVLALELGHGAGARVQGLALVLGH